MARSPKRDLAEWTVWYESDERNKRAFDEMQGFWIGSGALAAGAAGRERIQSLLDEGSIRSEMPPMQRASTRLLLALALAASVAIVGFTIHALAPKSVRPASSSPVHPSLVRETLLPDGSKVDLAPKSVLQVRYTPTERWVVLRRERPISR